MSIPSLLNPPTSTNENGGKLSATILSVYDIPTSTDGSSTTGPVPTYVSMSVLGKEVKTGKPSAKHKLMNNFKFVTNDKNSNGPATNALSLSAPLSILYPTTVTFRVVLDSGENLIAECKLSSTLQINEQQWLILNIYPESTFSKSASHSYTHSKPTDGKGEATTTTAPDSSSDHQPTLRLKLCLSGPYRTEIGAALAATQSWFQVIDSISSVADSTFSTVTKSLPIKFPSAKFLLVPTVPLAAAAVALLPIIFGVLVMGLPFFLPVLVIVLAIVAGIFLTGSGVYFSTSKGRESASIVLGPLYSTFVSTNAGQRLLYQTGPRPSPAALVKTVMPTDIVGKLIVSLIIDFIGSSSYLLPVVGEGFDLAWAPIQTAFIIAMYDETMPSLKYISFIEEILPFTDVIPSGTMGWIREFSPLIMEEGMKRAEDFSVVMRGERDAFMQGGRN